MRVAPPNSTTARQADAECRVAILYATENRFYIRMRDFIRTALNVSIRFTDTDATEYSDTIDAHAKVFRAIDNGNSERARYSMRTLIDDALVYIEDGLVRGPRSDQPQRRRTRMSAAGPRRLLTAACNFTVRSRKCVGFADRKQMSLRSAQHRESHWILRRGNVRWISDAGLQAFPWPARPSSTNAPVLLLKTLKSKR